MIGISNNNTQTKKAAADVVALIFTQILNQNSQNGKFDKSTKIQGKCGTVCDGCNPLHCNNNSFGITPVRTTTDPKADTNTSNE